MDKCLSAISVDAKIDVLGSILDGKIVIDNKKCRTAKFNSVISLIVRFSNTAPPAPVASPKYSLL